MKLLNRVISLCLVFSLLLTLLPMQALAEEFVGEEFPEEVLEELEVFEEETEPPVTVPAEETTAPTEETAAPTETAGPEEETVPPEQEVMEPLASDTQEEPVFIDDSESALNAADTVANGTCGEKLTWVLDTQGTLTISGSGKMDDFATDRTTSTSGYYGEAPWYDYRNAITAVIIQDGVTSIAEHAFRGQTNTRKVTIPSSVTTIDHKVYGVGGSVSGYSGPFKGCTLLNSAGPIGSGCALEFGWTERIPSGAFYCMENLTKIMIPGTVTSVGSNAFEQTGSALTTAGPIGSGCSYEFGWDEAIPEGAFSKLQYLNTVTLPDGIKTIGSRAFDECTGLKSISLPETVTAISEYAFYSCNTLESIIFPKNLKTIAGDAFRFCSTLQEITLPAGLTTLGDWAFSNCKGLKKASIPGSVGVVGSYLFSNCTSLETLVLGEGITAISETALSGCTGMKKITMPKTLTSIPAKLLKDCAKNITSAGAVGSGSDYEFGWTTTIPMNAFSGCSNLKKITIPDTITDIGSGAFTGCTGITSMGPVGSGCSLESDWEVVPFTGLSNISKIIMPESVSVIEYPGLPGEKITSIGPIGSGCDYEYGWMENIPEYAFYGMRKATEFEWPQFTENKYLSHISRYAFDSCISLEKIVIPETVTSIDISAFSACTGLAHVSICGPVAAIPQWAFRGCTALEEIVIPATVQYIGSQAFYNCNALKHIYYEGTEQMWNDIQVQYGNDALFGENVTVHFGYNAVYLKDIRYYSTYAGGIHLVGPDGEVGYKTSAEFTDSELLADVGALVGTYVIPVFLETDRGPVLKNLLPVESKSGIVTEADRFSITINGETFKTPIDLEEPEQYVDQFVIYQIYDGELAGIFVFSVVDHLNNDSIAVNGQGSAYAYYRTTPYQLVTCRINGRQEQSFTANGQGVLRIPLGTFQIPLLQQIPVEIIRVGNLDLDPIITLTPSVDVKPFSYTQTGTLNLNVALSGAVGAGGGLNIADWKAKMTVGSAEGSLESTGIIAFSRIHNEGYTDLELIAEVGSGYGVELASGIYAEEKNVENPSRFTLASFKSGTTSSTSGGIGIRIEEYAGEWEQNIAAAHFLLSMLANTYIDSPFLRNLLQNSWDVAYPVAIAFESASVQNTSGIDLGAVKIEGEDLFTLGTFTNEGAISMRTQYESEGNVKKSVQINTESGTDWGVLAKEYKKAHQTYGAELSIKSQARLTSDMEIRAERSKGSHSVTATMLKENIDSIRFLALGQYYNADYHRFTFRHSALDALVEGTSGMYSYLYGDRRVINDRDLIALTAMTAGINEPVEYAQETKQKALFQVPVTLGGGLGVEVYGGITFAMTDEISYDSVLGTSWKDELYITSETSDSMSQQVRDLVMDGPDFIQTLLSTIWEFFKDVIVTVGGAIKDGVQMVGAWITGKPDSEQDWDVSISAVETHSQPMAVSYMVDTVNSRQSIVRNDGIHSTGSYESDRAATIAKPYIIGVTDNATGAAVTDFSQEPLDFTISYTVEDLTAAGLSAQDSVVLGGQIAMYRYSDEGDYFEYVGGNNDLEAMTVTASITKPGQYVLAADSCAPALKSLDISDFRSHPTITAIIDDLTGLDAESFVFCLDGRELVTAANLADHYNAQAGLFTYTVEGEGLSEGKHTMSFTLADTSGNTDTYAYSFNVDLTAPEIADVTVNGAANAGSEVQIRAKVSDPNLTGVYAVLSKRISETEWSETVTTPMGDMGDGTWGLDYEGDGCSVKIQIKAVDVGDNTAESDVFEAKPYAESVTLSQEYIVLYQEQTHQLRAEVMPAELAGAVNWKVERGSEEIVSVENGLVKGGKPGTGYVLAEVFDGNTTLTARCRVDVRKSTRLDGVQLSTSKVTSELYSANYTEFDLLLILPQNVPGDPEEIRDSRSAVMASAESERGSVAVDQIAFTDADSDLAKYFALEMVDDRTVRLVPTQEAIDNAKSVKSKYTDTLTVTVQGQEYFTEKLTVNVKKSTPKLKAKVETFNSFYNGQSQEIVITGGTVISISENESKNTAKSSAVPGWLELKNGILTLTEDAPAKNISGKVYLTVMTGEWRIPANVTLSVKNAFKRPGLKLSASAVTVTTDTKHSGGIPLTLKCTGKKDTLDKLNIVGMEAPEGYYITGFDSESGNFILHTNDNFAKGKITLNAVCGDTVNRVPLKLTVKTAAVALKLNKTSVTLNRGVEDSAEIFVTATPGDYTISAPSIRLTDTAKKPVDKLDSGELEVRYDNGVIYVNTTEKTPAGASYRLCISAGGSKEASATIKVVDKEPTVSFKTKGGLDLSFPENTVTITPSFKNYVDGEISGFTCSIWEMKGKKVVNPDAKDSFAVVQEGNTFRLSWKKEENISLSNTYVLKIALTLPDGTLVKESQVSFKVKRTNVKLKLSSAKVSLNHTVGDTAAVAVTCTTKGYAFDAPLLELRDSKGKSVLAEYASSIDYEKLKAVWEDGKLHISLGAEAQPGDSFQLKVKANDTSSPVTLTVSVPKKSAITASLKAKGSIDVIRGDTAITVTPSYKNCQASTPRTQQLLVFTSKDQYTEPVDGLFTIVGKDGSFLLSNANLDPNLKYKVQLVADVNGTEVRSSKISVTVKTGKAKLSLKTTKATMFAKDKHSRAVFAITAADQTLNPIQEIRIKDARYQSLFELKTYGNGSYALAYKDGVVDESLMAKTKTYTVPIQVTLQGSAKVNATLNLKVTVLK